MILLNRLEIQGFKSFASKTVFDLPSRITGIVGPNGSGKSNVVDALRWVLGERTAKNLRGEFLENLIFAGTPKKAPAGFARVLLSFNNASRIFPFDSEEVAIERKIDKAGLSQFFINDAETKLRELAPILARVKLGARGLTIIGQGQSDLFVKSDGKERRAMIEEILGLKEYRLKKDEAERRLASSEVNMEKVRAMTEEIIPHLKFLRRQKIRWEERSKMEEESRGLENKYFGFHLRRLNNESLKYDEPIARLEKIKKEKESEENALLAAADRLEKNEGAENILKSLRLKRQSAFEEQSLLEKEIVRLETRHEFEKKSKNGIAETAEVREALNIVYEDLLMSEAINDLAVIKEKIRFWLKRLEKFFKAEEAEKEDEAPNRLASLKEELEIIQEKREAIQKQEESLVEMERGVNREYRFHFQEIDRKKNEIREIERQVQILILEKERSLLKKEEIENQWQVIGRSAGELQEILQNLKNGEAEKSELAGQDIERKITRLRAELSAIGETDEDAIKEADETEKRYEFLVKEIADLESAASDLKSIIKDLDFRIHKEFKESFKKINDAFHGYFKKMFGGGRARLILAKNESENKTSGENNENSEGKAVSENDSDEANQGVEIDIAIPRKKIRSLEMLSGGEKSLVSMAALFALVSVSAPPFLVLDEIDAALDDDNARRFADLVNGFSEKSQFIIVTHNKITMEKADVLYGITMGDDGVSRVLSLKFEEITEEQKIT